MAEQLLSVGIDVGTTTTQMVVSRLTAENPNDRFSVPRMQITHREVIFRSKVYFTPLLGTDRIDGPGVAGLVKDMYCQAGIRREDVDTGAVIITGETSRKENARDVVEALAELAGDFVVATAGPDLESRLAAMGAQATESSRETGKRVLHMDIGGGTANLAWIEDGRIIATGCLNVGGRLVCFDEEDRITYLSPVLEGLCDLRLHERVTRERLEAVARMLAQALEMAAGLREATDLLGKLWTKEAGPMWVTNPAGAMISFSGGVAACIREMLPWRQFGDLGPILGMAIRESRLCKEEYQLGEETIRATVIGAGSHSLQLSGSTVFYQKLRFPVKNLPVCILTREEQTDADAIRARRRTLDAEGILVIPGPEVVSYGKLQEIARAMVDGADGGDIYVAVEQDVAKALGQQMGLLAPERGILCIDAVQLPEGSYLEVGAPVGSAMPVVVKTLVMER